MNRPGPGVPKDAPPKSPFIVFFEILQRKFWNLVKVNLMFVFFNLPALIAGMAVMLFFFPSIFPDALENPEMLLSDMMLKFILLTMMMCIPMITFGPAQAGFTYIMRNYAREEHAFLWGDFKDTAIKNLKQSLISGTINFFVTFLILFSIRAYFLIGNGNMLMVAGAAIMVMAFVIFAMMNMYIYPIMITFDLPLRKIYKNSLIFAVIKLLPNIAILLLCAFIVSLSFGMIIPFNPLVGFLPYIFLTVSLTGFITNFYVYPKLKKYMIDRIEEEDDYEDEEEDDDDDEDEEDVDEDEEGEDEEKEEGADECKKEYKKDCTAGDKDKEIKKDKCAQSETSGAGAADTGEACVGEDGIKRYY
ncbi:MAG: YesL family protein [Acetivibrionales bacterium]